MFPWLPGWFLRGLEGKVTGEGQRVEVILITHICEVGGQWSAVGKNQEGAAVWRKQASELGNTLSRLRDSSFEGAVGLCRMEPW